MWGIKKKPTFLEDIDQIEPDLEEEQEFLAEIWEDKGFKSYTKIRNIVLLKKIAIAIEKRDIQTAYELNGRRYELLHFAGEAKKAFENIEKERIIERLEDKKLED